MSSPEQSKRIALLADEQNSADVAAEVTDILDEGRSVLDEYEEMGVPRPDERLSEAFPQEFATYCKHFIDVFPRSPYYVKTTYDPSSRYYGWPEKKSRKPKRPLALIDNGDFLNRTDCVERHLDYDQWLLFKDTTDPDRDHKFGDFFWLGQLQPKKTTFHALDLDNKRFLGSYRLGTAKDAPYMPVVHMPLEHFKDMKRIYDAFPDRIWCITSETLGLDVIERHSLQNTSAVHTKAKRQLARIGLAHTEVHPMTGRCKRRPFGEHYRTITQDSVLEPWQLQLEHYLNPGPTPSFDRISRVLLQAIVDQWSSWLSWTRFSLNSNSRSIINDHKPALVSVVRWLNDGCPLTDPVSAPVTSDVHETSVAPDRVTDSLGPKVASRKPQTDLPSLRDGRWPLALQQMAVHGLPCEDSVGEVVYELAKWLWWIELHDLPESERQESALSLLHHFVSNKNNGMSSRWNSGKENAVLSQATRCLRSARQLDNQEHLSVFDRIRKNRQQGKYLHVISIADSILSLPQSEATGAGDKEGSCTGTPSSSSSTYFSVGTLEDLNSSLPEEIIHRINKHRGRNRLIPYATRLINHLNTHKGISRLPHGALCQLLGYADRTRTTKYNKILIKAGIIQKDHFVRHLRPCGYWLTPEARSIMDQTKNESGSTAILRNNP